MPIPSFLSSIADKAQSAIHSSQSSHAVNALQNQIRAFGQQYTNISSATPVQKIITSEKSISIDFDSISRDARYQSKELYTWGQNEEFEDLRDVTDRLAYFNFVHGSITNDLAVRLNAARAPLKALRDAETAIIPRRNIRAGLKLELSRIEHSQQKGMERKMSELKDQIKKAELDDEPQEKELEILKRKAIRDSEQIKWEAYREYAEKVLLLSQASALVTEVLPSLPPSPNRPYTSAEATGVVRASLQHALDHHKPGDISLPPQLTGSDLSRSDTRSFGESHASELSRITSDPSTTSYPGFPTTPPISQQALPSQSPVSPNKSETHVDDKMTNAFAHVNQNNAVPKEINPWAREQQDLLNANLADTHDSAESQVDLKPASGDIVEENSDPTSALGDSETNSKQITPSKFESAEEEKQRLRQEEAGQISKAEATGEEKKDDGEDLPPKYQEL